MALLLNLSPEAEARLHEMASLHGQKPEEYAARMIDEMSLADKNEFDTAAGREISMGDQHGRSAWKMILLRSPTSRSQGGRLRRVKPLDGDSLRDTFHRCGARS